MHRFFLPMLQPNVGETISLRPIHNQLFRVLRVQPGDQVLLLDNAGSERLLEIVSIERREASARVLKVHSAPPEPAIPVTLYQCVLRGDKFDLVLQKATELGVTTIVPVLSSRTVARLGSAVTPKHTRWNTIVREAAEQSGRGALPTVAPACSFAEAIATASGARLIPWEEAKSKQGLLAALGQVSPPVESVSILIGPEGGLETSEVEQAKAAGWRVVSMGKRILRAETAAISALSVIALAMGDLGDAPLTHPPSAEADNQKRVESKVESKDVKPASSKPESAQSEHDKSPQDKTSHDKSPHDNAPQKSVTAEAAALESEKAGESSKQGQAGNKPAAKNTSVARAPRRSSAGKPASNSKPPVTSKRAPKSTPKA